MIQRRTPPTTNHLSSEHPHTHTQRRGAAAFGLSCCPPCLCLSAACVGCRGAASGRCRHGGCIRSPHARADAASMSPSLIHDSLMSPAKPAQRWSPSAQLALSEQVKSFQEPPATACPGLSKCKSRGVLIDYLLHHRVLPSQLACHLAVLLLLLLHERSSQANGDWCPCDGRETHASFSTFFF